MESSFISRWSKRKLDGESDDTPETVSSEQDAQGTELDAKPDEALSAALDDKEAAEGVEQTADDETSVAALLASEAESAIKKAALRKLFLSGEFSEVDRLNDYDHDYKSVKSLSSEVAAKLRDWMNQPEEETEEDAQTSIESVESDDVIDAHQAEEPQSETDTTDDMGQNRPY
ncbi:DUF3306 domain-containing protein [Vibrio japonicus]|uniref:DUF3306 domain-containing protein n=1 Tax=Vibrio japonicus TaxID=1824638 RepID=A0ABY5LKX0_9VIBR|nr:DUF3306 domain-containing protein [Vibrio japonicus]UUM31752.1 DUF3306 domain-containing protein [Vibrio japonicus]